MDIIDETTITRDGITYRVMVTPDYDSSPDDADCYSDSDKEAFKRGDWQYVGVIVRPVIAGQEFDAAEDSLWAVEYGHMPAEAEEYQGGMHPETTIRLDEIVNTHPVPDMISEVRAHLAQLRDSIPGDLA
jgi:hypothetical protein